MKSMLMAAILSLVPVAAPRADLYQPYAAVLDRFVDQQGLVDYAGLKADRADLDAFMKAIAATDPLDYARWSADEQLAYWLNAYNAYILTLVVDNYPIQPAPGRAIYPDNSVQQLASPWKRKRYAVMRETRAPDAIEHEIIRVSFKEPRIHAALVCGAMSCPPLRREPYRGDRLDQQLDDQCRRFFAELTNLQIDRDRNEVYASRIFDWFAEDFAPGVLEEEGTLASQRQAVASAAAPYLDAEKRSYLQRGDFTLKYFDYNWALNEQSK